MYRRNLVRPFAICERTVALEQFSRWATSFAGAEKAQTIFQILAMFRAKQNLLGAFRVAFGRLIEFTKCRPAAAAHKVDGRIRGDSRHPVSGFLLVFELFLVLQSLDEGFLGKVLSVGDVLHQMIDLHEDPPEVLGNKAVLPLLELQTGLDDVAHAAQYSRFHWSLLADDAKLKKTWNQIAGPAAGPGAATAILTPPWRHHAGNRESGRRWRGRGKVSRAKENSGFLNGTPDAQYPGNYLPQHTKPEGYRIRSLPERCRRFRECPGRWPPRSSWRSSPSRFGKWGCGSAQSP